MIGLGYTTNGSYSHGNAVSADGAVVVGQADSASNYDGFRWTQAGGVVGLGDLPGGDTNSEAWAVSADGTAVVGFSFYASGDATYPNVNQAFRWTQETGLVGLGHLPGKIPSYATGVSSDGSVVVGYCEGILPTEGFIWTQSGGMVGLGSLAGGSGFSLARAVSSDGLVVVGVSGQAFRWTQSAGMVGLGELPGGDQGSEALATSANGSVIVGRVGTASGDAPFIWDAQYGIRNLQTVLTNLGVDLTGWSLKQAEGISADGSVISGSGIHDGFQEGWVAYLRNLFPLVKGTYHGLFYNTNQVEQQSSGFFSLAVGEFGVYSAKLQMNGKSYPFKGTFSVDGRETNLVSRAGTNALLVELAVDLTDGTDQLTGTVTNNQVTAIDTNHAWSANLRADRAVFDGRIRVAPQAGNYTLLIPHDTNSPAGPTGDGFGAVRVTTKGALSFSGSLADGTKAVQKAFVSKSGAWPFYLPLSKDKGVLFSWVMFDTNLATTDFTGLANWFKQRQATAKYYPGGFTNETTILGSRYTPPTATNRVVSLTNATIEFIAGNLETDFTNDVRLDLNNKVVNLSSNKLTLNMAKPTGLFSGAVTPPGATRSLPYKGALLQKQDLGGGFILGTNRSGQVSFGP